MDNTSKDKLRREKQSPKYNGTLTLYWKNTFIYNYSVVVSPCTVSPSHVSCLNTIVTSLHISKVKSKDENKIQRVYKRNPVVYTYTLIKMTRKSNRVKARRARVRTLAEILEEEENQRHCQGQAQQTQSEQEQAAAPPQQEQQTQPRHLARLEELKEEIEQYQEKVIQEHETTMLEIDRFFQSRPQIIGNESVLTLEEVRQFSHQQFVGTGQTVQRCQELLQKIIDSKELFRQAQMETEERAMLRRKRHQLQSQLFLLLESILGLNVQFYHKLESYLDHFLYQVLQRATTLNREDPGIQEWIQSVRSNPDFVSAMKRYSQKFGLQSYRSSQGRMYYPTTHTSTTNHQKWSQVVVTKRTTPLMVHFGGGDVDARTDAMDVTNSACSICLMDYQAGDIVFRNATKEVIWILVTCNHFFHKECIKKWLERQTSCPCCRHHFSIRE